MNALAKLASQVVVSPEVKEYIESLINQFNQDANKMREARLVLANLGNTIISSLFDQIHFSKQIKLIQDVETLSDKIQDPAYAKLTEKYWIKISDQVISELLGMSETARMNFDDKYVYIKPNNHATEFNIDNVLHALVDALRLNEVVKSVIEQAEIYSVDQIENGFNSARAKLIVGSIETKAKHVIELQNVINRVCELHCHLEANFADETGSINSNQVAQELTKNEGNHVRITKSLSAKLFKNGNVQLTIESRVASVLSSMMS